MCTADACGGGTFLNSSTGNCVGKYVVVNTTVAMRPFMLFFAAACAAGCRACTGPNNSDCLACEDETLYRVTTDQRVSNTCITADECATPTISAFGDRICNMIKIITTPTSELPTTPTESSTLPTVSPTTPIKSPTPSTVSPTGQGVSLVLLAMIAVNINLLQGGASSIHYHQFWLLIMLLVYLL